MNTEEKNKLQTRILIEKNSNNLLLEYFRQNKFSPEIEFKAHQSAGCLLMNYIDKHKLLDSFVAWKKKNDLD